jgi:alkaline phosphatase D
MHPPLYPAGPFTPTPLSRRTFLTTTASLAAATLWSSRATGAIKRNAILSDYPFQLGVASGDPSPDGFVLWTRLAPKPLEGGGMPAESIEVTWQVAEDEAMTRIVRQGTTVATPDWAHSVHVEVDGLRPDRWYHYRFTTAGEVSPIGRTRTAPAADATPDRLKFAFASCQHYEDGYYTAYEHMLREDNDLVVHLGDYIYEGAGVAPDSKNKKVRRHVGDKELAALADYRNRHAQYKTDEALQAMHRHVPWLVTWDDHEFDNNCAGAISEEKNVSPEKFLRRRTAAYQAYYEHMPLRRASLPRGPDMKIYRRVPFGRIAEFFVLDTRQYRTDQPCGDGNKSPCPANFDPNATALGDEQQRWLFDNLSASSGKWNVLASQIIMARVDRTVGPGESYSMDQWPGYEMNRRRLLRFLDERKVTNPIVIAGDIHTNWANDLIADFDSLDSRTIASEFVGTSLSSGGDGTAKPKTLEVLSENPFVKFHNAERGYVSCLVTPKEWRGDYQVVPYVTRKGAPLVTRASFVVEDGRRGLQMV